MHAACKVSEIRSDKDNDTKRKQFIFRITWPVEDDTTLNKDLDSACQPVKSTNESVDNSRTIPNPNNNKDNNNDNNKDNTKDVTNSVISINKTKKCMEKKKKYESKEYTMSTGICIFSILLYSFVLFMFW